MTFSADSCMGGWCSKREHCVHHHAADPAKEPSERLCVPGQDGVRDGFPIRIHRPAGTWERLPSQQTPADPFPRQTDLRRGAS